MVLIKDDQEFQGTITLNKMWQSISMGKGNAQLTCLNGEKSLHSSAQGNV